MQKLTENQMRELFASSGFTYEKNVTLDNVTMLHSILVQELMQSTNFDNTYRMNHKIEYKTKRNKAKDFVYSALTCNAFYFSGREAVSFNPDGFIGFCGWSDSVNNQPILRGFKKWCEWLAASAGEGE